MSRQDDSENDIWEYKPLQKKKKGRQAKTGGKRASRKSSLGARGKAAGSGCGEESRPDSSDPKAREDGGEGSSSGDSCPVCQMPFSILRVQSHRWHVAECLDSPRDQCTECPDGLRCSSTIPNHYRRFDHTLLARSRANGEASALGVTRHASVAGQTDVVGRPPGQADSESSQDVALELPASSGRSVSPDRSRDGTPTTKLPNGLLLLRSPGPEDFKKKKGWLSSPQSQKTITSSQESKKEVLTPPVKEEREPTQEGLPEAGNLPECDDAISYSPLSELPADVTTAECRKALFSGGATGDGFSSDDDAFAEYVDSQLGGEGEWSPPNAQLGSVPSSGDRETPSGTSVRSPQSLVLERLRDSLPSSDGVGLGDRRPPPATPPSQNSVGTVPPAGLRQTDIGVFFGLKPLKEKEAATGPKEEAAAAAAPAGGESSGRKRQRRERQRKPRGDAAAAVAVTDAASGGGEAGRGGGRRWRRGRWGRTDGDGDAPAPRCPFYKKIPGTRFTVDAFRYGEIEGVTGYFLTHFHSDHYGGLTRNATLPIYCNAITGNLVKSKLKVAERYVHVLPMNTEVTVDGVKVVLLDANHCPGAAMLLFFLPDGQTVLHTGDFRADPSMEKYPELLGCRVQTLYLDTTYCSPEYTFPTQQEAISFAVGAAFQSVTLNPRTLVVCGSYSVGKEKVFLALADVLGSKVCLSRDKYNTMCCLESAHIRERITTDWKAARVHVLPMMHLNFSKLRDHLTRFSQQYDRLVAFKPTGWTFSGQAESLEDIRPQVSGDVSIYGVPYSEHSSFAELRRFVRWLRPLKIIPTVNVGS